jgi:hypothetical protein
VPELLLPRQSYLSAPPVMEPPTLIPTGQAVSASDDQNTGRRFPVNKMEKAEEVGQVMQPKQFSDRRHQILIPSPEPTTVRSLSRQPKGAAASRNPELVVSGLNKTKPEVERFQRAKPEARQPDEIQIHIGRIEVTAVHPAPISTAAKFERNVPSLDEYLRRRDRRST